MIVFPGQRVLSCLLPYEPGYTMTDRPLTIEIVPIKAAKDESRPERYRLDIYEPLNRTSSRIVRVAAVSGLD